MAVFTSEQQAFLREHELCRLATVSKEGRPHVVPVIYALDGEDVVVATDYGTKKLSNLKENRRVALVVDEYHPNRAIMVEGECEVFERGEEYMRLLRVLLGRFETYRKNPWGEGEAPILKVKPTKAVMW